MIFTLCSISLVPYSREELMDEALLGLMSYELQNITSTVACNKCSEALLAVCWMKTKTSYEKPNSL